jgi:hypothetical protein
VVAVVDDVEDGGVAVGALHLLGGGASPRGAVRAPVVGARVARAEDVLLPVLAPAVAVVGGALLGLPPAPPRNGSEPASLSGLGAPEQGGVAEAAARMERSVSAAISVAMRRHWSAE